MSTLCRERLVGIDIFYDFQTDFSTAFQSLNHNLFFFFTNCSYFKPFAFFLLSFDPLLPSKKMAHISNKFDIKKFGISN